MAALERHLPHFCATPASRTACGGTFYPTCGDPHLLTAKEFRFWQRQKHLHTHKARGTSPRMEEVTEQLSHSLITLITYKLALL